jgi:hypothetical protein
MLMMRKRPPREEPVLVDQAAVALQTVRVAVEGVGREVGDIVATLREVAQAAESISQIALQTRLVAFNASVEAKTYRRDMGGGHFIVMKEAAAPITVDGRHWGGLRLAFKF